MVFVYGWGTKATPLGITDIRTCDRCNTRGPWLVYKSKKQIKLYWIPVAQWNKKYVIECSVCPNAFEVSEQEANRLIAEGEKDGEDRFLKALAAILKSTAKVGGLQSKEWARAVTALVDMSEGRVSRAQAERLLQDARQTDVDPSLFEEQDRLVLLYMALEVAIADGVLDPPEVEALEQLAARLQVPLEVLHLLIARATGEADPSGQGGTGQGGRATTASDRQRACDVLGVAADASLADIRSAYKEVVRQNHPDLAAPDDREEATRKTALINAAYSFLLGKTDTMSNASSGASGASGGRTTSGKQQSSSRPKPPPPPRNDPPKSASPALCTACERRVAANAKFCGFCGTALQLGREA
jgi:DnaJ-domain-containing protein 1